jgi:excisionase family DNA binding protein
MTTTVTEEREKRRAELEELCADGMLTIKQAAAFSGIGKSQLYELIAAKRLVSMKEGTKSRLIPKRALVALLAERLVSEEAAADGRAH